VHAVHLAAVPHMPVRSLERVRVVAQPLLRPRPPTAHSLLLCPCARTRAGQSLPPCATDVFEYGALATVYQDCTSEAATHYQRAAAFR
jgi:hypothetical protein